jgi:hypothetical protein
MQTPVSEPLGLRAWANAIGRTELARVLAAAGIGHLYFTNMANYSKTCTPATCERIEGAARELGLTVLPDYETCTRPTVVHQAQRAKMAAKTAPQVAERQAAAERAAARAPSA